MKVIYPVPVKPELDNDFVNLLPDNWKKTGIQCVYQIPVYLGKHEYYWTTSFVDLAVNPVQSSWF